MPERAFELSPRGEETRTALLLVEVPAADVEEATAQMRAEGKAVAVLRSGAASPDGNLQGWSLVRVEAADFVSVGGATPVNEPTRPYLQGDDGRLTALPADRELRVGRDAAWATLVIDDRRVSKKHAIFKRDADGVTLLDRSQRGTTVNGARVARDKAGPLHDGDVIRLADAVSLVLHALPPPVAEEVTRGQPPVVEPPTEVPPKPPATTTKPRRIGPLLRRLAWWTAVIVMLLAFAGTVAAYALWKSGRLDLPWD